MFTSVLFIVIVPWLLVPRLWDRHLLIKASIFLRWDEKKKEIFPPHGVWKKILKTFSPDVGGRLRKFTAMLHKVSLCDVIVRNYQCHIYFKIIVILFCNSVGINSLRNLTTRTWLRQVTFLWPENRISRRKTVFNRGRLTLGFLKKSSLN